MQNHYEINVALNGRHFFATAPRSCRTEEEAKAVVAELKKRFLEAEGFKVTCTYWQGFGETINF